MRRSLSATARFAETCVLWFLLALLWLPMMVLELLSLGATGASERIVARLYQLKAIQVRRPSC